MAEPQAEKTNRDRLRDLLQGGMEKSSVRVATNFAPLINQLGISPESTAALIMGGDKSPLPLGMGVADFVPFLGTALGVEDGIQDLKDARQAIKNDDYLGAGVDVAFAALGLIPGAIGTAKYGRKAFNAMRDTYNMTKIPPMRNIDLRKIPALMRPPTHAKLPTTPVEQGMAKGGSARSRLAELLADDGAHMAVGGRAKALVKGLLKPDTPVVNRIEMGFKDVTKRIPELTEAANLVKAGKMSAKEFEQLVNYFKPVTPYDFVPKPASRKEAMGALKENQRDLYGVPSKTLEEGYPVGGRLDISAYKDHGVWVPTVHEQTGGFGAGRVIGHESVMSLKDPSFGMHPEAALSIAAGNPKGTIATIKGDWDPVSDDEAVARAREYLRHKDWVQAGMDPERHSYFYDRRSMDPVLAGDQAYQIGPLVLVKNPKYGDKKDFKYAAGGEVHMARGGKLKKAVKGALENLLPMSEREANKSKFLEPSKVQERLYHATPNNFKEFKPGGLDPEVSGEAIWLSNDPKRQPAWHNIGGKKEEYRQGVNVMPVHVQANNPMLLDDEIMLDWARQAYAGGDKSFPLLMDKKWADEIKKDYDSIIFADPHGRGDPHEVIMFEPKKIKSAIGNRGTYDVNDADINKANGGAIRMAKGGRAKAMLKSAIGRGRADIREPQTTTSITKEGGGNWLAGSVEGAMSPLKRQARAEQNPETNIWEYLPEKAKLDPMNQWIDKQLTRYVKNQMATKEDPIRALAEKGTLHVNPDQLNFNPFTYGKYLSAGQKVVAQSPTAKSWEGVSDLSISPMIAKQLLGNDGTRMGRGDSILENNPWLNKVPEETSVYSMTDPQGVPSDLGFDHLIDELRNATNPASGLPRELLIKPESLSKLSVPQAVERVAKINEWRAAQQAKADLVRANNAATVMHKDYPEKNMKWVELKMPKGETPSDWDSWTPDEQKQYLALPNINGRKQLEDALKYEGETMGHCGGGYCPDVMEGRSRIYSLRDAKGQPHVTIEETPHQGWFDKAFKMPDPSGQHRSFHELIDDERGRLAKQKGGYGAIDENYEDTANRLASQYQLEAKPAIAQIKGKGNKKPNEEYLPFVQDFVKSGKWSDVGDFSNTGLMRIAPESNEALYLQRQNKPIPEYVSDQEYEEIRRGMADAMRSPYGAADEMKEGGVVHMDKGGAPESPETPEQQFQHYLRMLRINATGGKDQHGTGVGGRLGLNMPVSENVSIEPYVQGFAFKPGSGKLMNGGVGGANLNIRFKNGGEVHMKKGGKAKGAIKSGLRNMLSETAAPPPGVEPIVVRPKDERELKGAMRPSVEPVRGQTSKEMQAAQREQLTPQQQEKLKALKSQYPDFAQATKFMMPGEVSKIIENPNGVKEMNALLQVIPNAKEMAAVAKTGEAKRGWYRASTQAIMNVFGDDAPRFSSLLAALSPQNSVETNLLNTLNTWKNWTAAGRPTDDRSIREVLGRSVQGTKGEESVLEAWAQNAIRSLSAQDPSKVVLSGAKVDSFWRNLADDVNRVTNDAWQANGMGVQQKLFGQKPTDLQLQRGDPGLTPGYIGASARTREAGQIANMFPSEAQETTWSTFMPLYEMQERLGLPAREILQRGLLTPEVIRGTPDFSTLFNQPTYRRILDESGYGEQLSNLKPHQWPEARIDLNLSEQRALDNTARRLEGLRSDRNKETRSRTVSLPPEGRPSRAYPFETAEYIPMRGAGHAEELIDAPFGQRQAFTSKMSGAFTDFAGKDVLHGALDLQPLRATGALGSYQPPGRYPWMQLPKEVQPMFALGHESPVTASLDIPKRTHDKMRSAAALRGAMTGQGGQAYNVQIPDPNGTSLLVPLDKKVGKDEMTFSAGLVPENTFLADTGRGMSVINYGDKYGGEEAKLIAQRLGGTDSVPTTSRGDYIDYSKDWQQPQGSSAVTTKMLSHMGPLSVRDFNELSKAAQVPAGEVYDAYRALESNKGYVVREDLMHMLRILRDRGIPGVAAALAAGEALPSEPEQAKRMGGLASLKYGGGRA